MKWSEMMPEQRNRLVAEKIMGWTPGPCDGELGEQPISAHGWICLRCGKEGRWRDDTKHDQLPPWYSGWEIRDKMIALDLFVDFRYEVGHVCSDSSFHTVIKELDDNKMAIAALRVLGEEIEL